MESTGDHSDLPSAPMAFVHEVKRAVGEMRLRQHAVEHVGGQSLEKGDAFAQRLLEVDFASHGALGDARNEIPMARGFAQKVNDLLVNERGIDIHHHKARWRGVGVQGLGHLSLSCCAGLRVVRGRRIVCVQSARCICCVVAGWLSVGYLPFCYALVCPCLSVDARCPEAGSSMAVSAKAQAGACRTQMTCDGLRVFNGKHKRKT